MTKRTKLAIAGGVVATAAVVGGIVWWRRSRPQIAYLIPTAFPQVYEPPLPPPPQPKHPTIPPPPQPVPVPQGPGLPPGFGQ